MRRKLLHTIFQLPSTILNLSIVLAIIPALGMLLVGRDHIPEPNGEIALVASRESNVRQAVRAVALDQSEEQLLVAFACGTIRHYDRSTGAVTHSFNSGNNFLYLKPVWNSSLREPIFAAGNNVYRVTNELTVMDFPICIQSSSEDVDLSCDISAAGTAGIVSNIKGEIVAWRGLSEEREMFHYRLPLEFYRQNYSWPSPVLHPRGDTLCVAITPNVASICDAASGNILRDLQYVRGRICSITYSKNGEFIGICSNGGNIYVFEEATGKEYWNGKIARSWDGERNDGYVYGCAVSNNGRWVAGGLTNGVALFDTTRSVNEMETHLLNSIQLHNKVMFSTDSRTLFTACMDGRIEEWSVPQMLLVRTYNASRR